MLMEPVVIVQVDKSFVKDLQKHMREISKSKFESKCVTDEQYESMFRLLLEEVQKQSREVR